MTGGDYFQPSPKQERAPTTVTMTTVSSKSAAVERSLPTDEATGVEQATTESMATAKQAAESPNPEPSIAKVIAAELQPKVSPPPIIKHFNDLPEDIHHAIISFVLRPTDRVSLCLTSKHLHQLTVRTLYRVIEFSLGSPKDVHIPAFLNPSNIGLKWIREVELYLEHYSDSTKDAKLKQADFTIRLLLEMLPRDQLDHFRWHPWDDFGAENMVLLFKRQRKLKWVGAIGLDKPWTPALEKELNLDAALQYTTRLGLYPDSTSSLEFSSAVLRRTWKQVDKMTLHCNFESDEDVEGYLPGINDTPTGPGLLTRTVFRHMLPFERCQPLMLMSITLEGVNLRYCLESYCRVLSFPKVTKLSVCHCRASDALLAALCHSSRLPERLVKFEFKNEDDERECEVMAALDTFLCLVSGIRVLTVDVTGTKRLPSCVGITRHARTLEVLNCHAWKQKTLPNDCRLPYTEKVWDNESFEKITKACKRIEQLSVAFPITYLGHPHTPDYAAFCSALGNFSSLVTCNITTWPQNKSVSTALQWPRKMYETLLCAEAQDGFETSIANAEKRRAEQEAAAQTAADGSGTSATTAPATATIATTTPEPVFTTSKLRLIAFGISDRIYDREDSSTIYVFVRGEAVHPLGGRPKVQAMRLDMNLMRYFEPRCELLDTPLSHMSPPPVIREVEGDEEWD